MFKAKVNDYVIVNEGVRDRTAIRKVVHVDAKGRLYLYTGRDWRDGFDPKTHLRAKGGNILRLATKEEIREHLRVEEQKAEDRRRETQRRQSQEWIDMQFIQSTIEHQPEQFLGTFTKDEIHEIAERLRQQEEDKANG